MTGTQRLTALYVIVVLAIGLVTAIEVNLWYGLLIVGLVAVRVGTKIWQLKRRWPNFPELPNSRR